MPLLADLKRAIALDERPQSGIAEVANIHPVRLSAFVNDRGKLGVDVCERLAEALGYEVQLVSISGKSAPVDRGQLAAAERVKLRKALTRALELLGAE